MTRPSGLIPATVFQELLQQAQARSQEAEGILLLACQPALLRKAARLISTILQAKVAPEDIVQETFVKVHCKLAFFRGDFEGFRLWLFRILGNAYLDCQRRYGKYRCRAAARERPLLDLDPADAAQEELQRQGQDAAGHSRLEEEAAAVHAALAHLDEADRHLLQLRSDKLPYREIGRRLGYSAEVARKLFLRYYRSENGGGVSASSTGGILRGDVHTATVREGSSPPEDAGPGADRPW